MTSGKFWAAHGGGGGNSLPPSLSMGQGTAKVDDCKDSIVGKCHLSSWNFFSLPPPLSPAASWISSKERIASGHEQIPTEKERDEEEFHATGDE